MSLRERDGDSASQERLAADRYLLAPLHWNGDARSGYSTTGWLRFLNHLPWQCYHFGGSGKSFYGESAALLNLCVSRLVRLCLITAWWIFPRFVSFLVGI